MPIKTSPDPRERRKVEDALERLRACKPRNTRLSERARRGSLQVNINTLTVESGVRRHRIEKLYPDLAATATEERGERGSAIPLRRQLDAAREEKASAEKRLELSRAYGFRLTELITKLRTEIQALKDRVSELEKGGGGSYDDETFFGTDAVIGTPPMPSRSSRSAR